jgi:uncharacterized protein YdeI (BOF family)
MSTIGSSTSVQDLATSLMKTFDTNSDGKLTTDEFGAFLTKLLSGVTSASAAATATGSTTTAAAATGSTGSSAVKFEGFDFSVTKDPLKSAKYSFANAAKAAGTMPANKTEAETWFNTNIKAKMQADGHTINWVKGDKFQFTDASGTFTVDYVRGADSGSPALAWQPE